MIIGPQQRFSDGGNWNSIRVRVPLHRPLATNEHKHSDIIEIHIALAGRFQHHINGVVFTDEPGQISILRSNDAHFLSGSACEWLNIGFHIDHWLACDAVFEGRLQAFQNAEITPRIRLDPRVTSQLNKDILRLDNKDYADAVQGRRLLLRILECIFSAQEQGSSSPLWLSKLLQNASYLPLDELNPGVLAALSQKTPEHMARCFKKYLSCTPSSWICELRLQRAAYLLRQTKQPIARIALDCGFSNASYFSTNFRHRYAMGPRQFRQSAVTEGY